MITFKPILLNVSVSCRERERESSEQELLVINFNQNVMNIEEIKQNVMVAQERKKSYRK